MNRFHKKNLISITLHKIKLPILAFLLFLIVFLYGIQSVSTTTSQKQSESLENAIYRTIVHCYAVEGFYPPNLTYLEDHYGLSYDKDSFFVDYQTIASNIMPDVTIIAKEH